METSSSSGSDFNPQHFEDDTDHSDGVDDGK